MHKIYFINLDRSVSRRMSMLDQLNCIKFPYERIQAIDGSKLSENAKKVYATEECILICDRGYRTEHCQHNYGSIGCYVSHLLCWHKIIKDNVPLGIICEDDIIFCDGFCSKIQDLLMDVPHWDVIVISKSFPTGDVISKHWCPRLKTYLHKGSFILLGTYIINLQTCNVLVKDALPTSMQVDWWLSSQDIDIWYLSECYLSDYDSVFWKNSEIKHTPVVDS